MGEINMAAADVSDGRLFRESLKGYNKHDVHAFIEKMNKVKIETESSLKINADRLLRQKNDMERVINELNEKNAALSRENGELSEKLSSLHDAADENKTALLEDEIYRLNKLLEQKENECKESTFESESEPEQGHNASPEFIIRLDEADSGENYDKTFEKINRFVQLANETAKATISEAERKADEILVSAQKQNEAYLKERQEKIYLLDKQYTQLCVKSGEILKQLIQTHTSLDEQINDSTKLDGDKSETL